MKAHHVGIHVKDMLQAQLFYETMFGFIVEHRLDVVEEQITFMKLNSIRIELITSQNMISKEGTVHIAWEVENLDEWISKLDSNGLLPTEGPIFLENGWKTVFYQGPNLEVIELIEA
jgi:lactoylglutathione lyase